MCIALFAASSEPLVVIDLFPNLTEGRSTTDGSGFNAGIDQIGTLGANLKEVRRVEG